MNNLFPPHKDIHETYDLKGSTVGREYPEDKAERNPRAVLKDLNWIHRGKALDLGPEKRALLTDQLRRDAEFLKSIIVVGHSLYPFVDAQIVYDVNGYNCTHCMDHISRCSLFTSTPMLIVDLTVTSFHPRRRQSGIQR